MRWFDNLPASIKIGVLSGSLLLALAYISYEAFDGFESWSIYSQQIRDNRLPTIKALTRIDTDRALIRAQTFEAMAQKDVAQSKVKLHAIAEKRAESWRTIDQNWEAVSKIPRLTEQGRQQFARMTEDFKAWRNAYVELDALLQALIDAKDQARFDQLMADYRRVVETVFPISGKMGESTEEMVAGNMARASAQADEAVKHAGAHIQQTILLAAVVFVFSVILSILTFISLARPLRSLVEKFAAIGNGDYDQVIDEDRRDEVGQALKGLASMQSKLKADIGETRRVASESLRIRYALDSVASNVMVSVPSGEIIYANPSVIEMFRHGVVEIRRDLPNFDPERLVGSSIDLFHKNPAHQNRMMEAMRSRYETQITIGGRIFALIANPISDSDGTRLGTVIEWKDRTEEVKIEREVTALVDGAVAGDFSNRVATEELDGFFKRLGDGINTLMELTARGLGEVVRVLGAVSHGDLTQRMDGDYQGTFGQLKDDTNNTVTKLRDLIGQIKESADTINTAAREIAVGNTDLSQRTEEQASSLEETASSMEELTSTVKQNADNARQANLLANGAREVAAVGGEKVQQAVTSMTAITASSVKISDIITVIDGIAFQTNILALNAAVEAARAGEQGRGFAVVAAEVRALAQRSAAAAKEIKTLISEDSATIATGSKLIREAGETMVEIVTQVKRVSDIIAEISAASDEQTSGIEQVNQAITQMDDVTQQNASLVEEAAAAAESLEEQAQGLARAVAVFRVDDSALARSRMDSTGVAPRRPSRPAKAPQSRAPADVPSRLNGSDDQWEEF